MRYYRGPWQWVTIGPFSFWAPPSWVVASIDLRPLGEQGQQGGTPGLGIFVANQAIADSNYDLLCTGSWYSKPDKKTKDAIPKRKNYNPKGDDFIGILWDVLTNGADPTGHEFAKPIMPTASGLLELHLGQRHCERQFKGRLSGTQKDVLRADFRQLFAEVQSGKVPSDLHQKCLDFLCEKYAIDDWREFVPADLQASVPGRKQHDTTISDNFNRSDGDALGTSSEGWSWTEMFGDIDIVSNTAEIQTAGGSTGAGGRAESDLSSVDHYTQIVLTNASTMGSVCSLNALARKDSTATQTYYQSRYRNFGGTLWESYKIVSGTATAIGSSTSAAASSGDVLKVECNGSTITRYRNGTSQNEATDTAITTGTRCGIAGYQDGGTKPRIDNFQAADLAAGGILYTQLERSTRGLMRGVYTRF